MIELLGSSVVSSVATAGLKEFVSIFRRKPSRAYGTVDDRRYMATTRGILINERYLEGTPQLDKGYQFQFNPQTIDDIKETLWEARGYTGLAYNDYVWAGGGERTITFQLFLDNTPASKYRGLVSAEKAAPEIKSKAKFGYDANGKLGSWEKNYIGKSLVEEFVSQGKTAWDAAKGLFAPGAGPSRLEFTPERAVPPTRVDERGILPEVELIQSFLYPEVLDGEQTPQFASGGVISANQFRPPATVILCVGPIYLRGHVKAAPVHYMLFDTDLTPLRATMDIEFGVMEFANLTNKVAGIKTNAVQ